MCVRTFLNVVLLGRIPKNTSYSNAPPDIAVTTPFILSSVLGAVRGEGPRKSPGGSEVVLGRSWGGGCGGRGPGDLKGAWGGSRIGS